MTECRLLHRVVKEKSGFFIGLLFNLNPCFANRYGSMKQKPTFLYLDLIKKTLLFTLWPEPPMPITTLNFSRPPITRFFVNIISKILKKKKLQIGRISDFTTTQRNEGQTWPGYADTMIGTKRLDNLQYCIETVLNEGIKGDMIETGVWRGGACIFMRAILAAYGVTDRKIYLADSFMGLPKPNAEKYPIDKDDTNYLNTYLAVSQEEVENNFFKYGLLDDQVVFLNGWFKDTLPQAPIEKLAILRLDGDMYGSTMVSLECLYPKLSRGGFCIIDDYNLLGCRLAVNNFRTEHAIQSELKVIDDSSRYWRKE